MTEQTSLIPFHGKAIEAILHQGQPHIVVRRVCEHLGIDRKSQQAKLRSKNLGGVIITPVAADGDEREMLCLPLRSLPMWLASINPRKVRADLRPMLEAYQQEATDVLYRHFMTAQCEATRPGYGCPDYRGPCVLPGNIGACGRMIPER